jgi:hypothetical protein
MASTSAMSASGGKADIAQSLCERPLLAQSGHRRSEFAVMHNAAHSMVV